MKKNKYSRIAESLIYAKNPSNYEKINKGFFKKVPEIEGYLLDLSKILKGKYYIILNMSKDYKGDKLKNIQDYNFGIIDIYNSANSLENYLANLNKNAKELIELLEHMVESSSNNKKETEIKKSRGGLPYGYRKDDEGKVVIERSEAEVVRKIFSLYSNLRSMRKVAEVLSNSSISDKDRRKFEVSGISDILHDDRYLRTKPSIISSSSYTQTQEILKRNRNNKNTTNRITKYY